MPIINPNPAPPTPQERLQRRADAFINQLNAVYRQVVSVGQQVSDFVWRNEAVTPQQAFDLFGTNAADLLKVSAAYKALISTYTGTDPVIMPPDFTVTANEDGTVTVAQTMAAQAEKPKA